MVSDDTIHKILSLHRDVFSGFNDTHFTHALGQEYCIDLSRETVRKILLRSKSSHQNAEEGRPSIAPAGPQRASRDMIQLDRPPPCLAFRWRPKTLPPAGHRRRHQLSWTRFEPAETTDIYFRLLKSILLDRDTFSSLYTYKQSILRIEHGQQPTIQEQH